MPSSASDSTASDSTQVRSPHLTAAHMSLRDRNSRLGSEHIGEGSRHVEEGEDDNPISEEIGESEASSLVYKTRKGKGGKFTRYSEGSSKAGPKKKAKKEKPWKLDSECLGGPSDPSVIPSFGGHVLFSMCDDSSNDRGVITHYTRPIKLEMFVDDFKLVGEVKKMVEASGLNHLSRCMLNNLDMPLLSAFIERWQPDTNTFHMPFGEITILLHDVQEILGLPIDGEVCGVSGDPLSSLRLLLNKSEKEMELPWTTKTKTERGRPIYKSGAVLTDVVADVRNYGSVEKQAEAYLAVLLGNTVFVDKSRDRIRPHLFPLLEEAVKVRAYAWGAGVLAYLYRQLGVATRVGSRGIAGCLTLLQAWIYEYFPTLRPHDAKNLLPDQPRVYCWKNDLTWQPKKENLDRYRVKLDGLTSSFVNWEPYLLKTYPRTSLYVGILRFMEITEPYQASRCLRQFGFVQVIPTRMLQPNVCSRPASGKGYIVNHPMCDELWMGRDSHMVVPKSVSKHISNNTSDVVHGYMRWFLSVSHPYFVHPDNQHEIQAPHLNVQRSYEIGCPLARRLVHHYSLESGKERFAFGEEHMHEYYTLANQLLGHYDRALGRRERGPDRRKHRPDHR